MSDLLPCPLCGASKGYELAKGDTSRWWIAVCAGCGDFVCECRSDSSTGYNAELPTHWGPADLEWNRAAKHAHELRLGLDSANAEIESLQRHCDNFLNEIARLRADLIRVTSFNDTQTMLLDNMQAELDKLPGRITPDEEDGEPDYYADGWNDAIDAMMAIRERK